MEIELVFQIYCVISLITFLGIVYCARYIDGYITVSNLFLTLVISLIPFMNLLCLTEHIYTALKKSDFGNTRL